MHEGFVIYMDMACPDHAFFMVLYTFGLLEAKQIYILPKAVKYVAGIIISAGDTAIYNS